MARSNCKQFRNEIQLSMIREDCIFLFQKLMLLHPVFRLIHCSVRESSRKFYSVPLKKSERESTRNDPLLEQYSYIKRQNDVNTQFLH